jgi:hypothetical protein
MKYFISYTIRDGMIDKNELKKLENHYNQQGQVYIDLLHNNSRFKQLRVLRELFTSDVFVLINTPKIVESPWVKIEVFIARIRNMKFSTINFFEKSISVGFVQHNYSM